LLEGQLITDQQSAITNDSKISNHQIDKLIITLRGREDADNRSAARSCRPPACSDRCSTSRMVPWARRCSCRPGVRIW